MATIDYAIIARLGVATLHEAAGQAGIIDLALVQVVPGSRVAGPARTALCAHGDNTMAHAAVAHAEPGDILVLTSASRSRVALLGDLLVTQAKARGVAGILVDGAVRDLDELVALAVPIWAREVSARGASKGRVGALDAVVTIGGIVVRPGDIVVMDCDGAMALERDRVDEVLPLAIARGEREEEARKRFAKGELSYDTYGLREVVEGGVRGRA